MKAAMAVAVIVLSLAACSSPAAIAPPRQAPTPQPTYVPDSAVGTFGGTATWYCSATSPCTAGYGPADLVAAIDPSTGVGRGERLTVHHAGRSVDVTVVDVCACGGERVIDLTSGAFSRLAPLSRGVIDVAIEVAGPAVTPPQTDSGGTR